MDHCTSKAPGRDLEGVEDGALTRKQDRSIHGRADRPVVPRGGCQVRRLQSATLDARFRFLGLNPAHPPPIEPRPIPHHDPPPLEAILPLPHRHKARRRHGLPRPPHLRPQSPIRALLPSLATAPQPHRGPALAAPRKQPQVHDASCSVHAQRRRVRQQ